MGLVVNVWRKDVTHNANLTIALAKKLPHPDAPALGVLLASLVNQNQLSINLDDRDLNHFSLNPSCNATYLNMHRYTWVVHHVDAEAMHCMWAIDNAAGDCAGFGGGCHGVLPDLCSCSMDVFEEVNEVEGEEKF